MISTFLALIQFEYQRISRSTMRFVAICVFLFCGFYAITSGAHHVEIWKQSLVELESRDLEQRTEALGWFANGAVGPEDRDWINITQPRWADRYAAAHAAMVPEPLAALAIGLSDIRSSWAVVSATRGAQPFRTSDPSTLGNAEKLLAGNFDLVFVLAYLMPLLLLVLMFDVGSLERDLGMMRMVRTQTLSPRAWWFLRVSMPVLLVAVLVLILCLIGGVRTGAIEATFDQWLSYCGISLGYTFLWGLLFAAVLSAGTGSSTAALWMVGLWIGFCVIVPAAVRQVVSSQMPTLYASETTSVLRAERYEILLGNIENYKGPFYAARPQLSPPVKTPARAIVSDMDRLVRQAAFMSEVEGVSQNLSESEVSREAAVARFGWINPAYVYQRALCVLSGTESVSYRQHRQVILDSVKERQEALIQAQWKMKPVDKETFESLFSHGPWMGYGQAPEKGTYSQLLVLAAAAFVATGAFSRIRKSRERKTGVV